MRGVQGYCHLPTHGTLLDSPPQRLEPGQYIPEGGRHRELYRMACSLRNKGLEEDAILAALDKTNQSKCETPLPAKDIAHLVASSCKHAPGIGVFSDELPQQFRYSQADNAARFVARYQERVAWVPEWKTWQEIREVLPEHDPPLQAQSLDKEEEK